MRTWSWRRRFADGKIELMVNGWPVEDELTFQFIVDACNGVGTAGRTPPGKEHPLYEHLRKMKDILEESAAG